MKQLAINNNTTGASIYDLGQLLQADSMGTLNSVLKAAEDKQQQQIQAQQQHEQEMQQQQQQVGFRSSTKRSRSSKRYSCCSNTCFWIWRYARYESKWSVRFYGCLK